MLTVDEALALVLDRADALPPSAQSLLAALGCTLAEDVAADADQPPFDKALVDGYALRASDIAAGDRRLAIGETILAGQTPARPLGPREAVVIMTGAPLPEGADAVVMHEHNPMADGTVQVQEPDVRPGRNRLVRGQVHRAGDVLLHRGTVLGPAHLGLLASVGRPSVRVVPRPRVAIVPTGDELVEPDQVPGPGQIRNSNGVMLEASCLAQGVHVQALPIARDESQALRRILKQGLEFDVLLVTGGVSAGQRDLVPGVLEELGVGRIFHKVRLKPGKPLWFGVGPARDGRPGLLVFGLPGNPVSGLVSFLLFVRPALERLSGRAGDTREPVKACLAQEFVHRGDRPTYHPARWVRRSGDSTAAGTIEPLAWSGSADLLGVARADGLAVFPAGDRVFREGEIVSFLPLH
jgi:molybdopterin molybdotransferase